MNPTGRTVVHRFPRALIAATLTLATLTTAAPSGAPHPPKSHTPLPPPRSGNPLFPGWYPDTEGAVFDHLY